MWNLHAGQCLPAVEAVRRSATQYGVAGRASLSAVGGGHPWLCVRLARRAGPLCPGGACRPAVRSSLRLAAAGLDRSWLLGVPVCVRALAGKAPEHSWAACTAGWHCRAVCGLECFLASFTAAWPVGGLGADSRRAGQAAASARGPHRPPHAAPSAGRESRARHGLPAVGPTRTQEFFKILSEFFAQRIPKNSKEFGQIIPNNYVKR